jgi:hypothetical protein
MLDPARLVFLDETCTSTAMVRLRGRSPRGKRLVGYAPHGHRKTITLHREIVWVIICQFRSTVFCCCCRCGHVGNALALSIMSIAILRFRVVAFVRRQ